MTGPPRFLADEMLGRLARWLRLLGYDVAYIMDVGDDALLHRARLEQRQLLTRDRELAHRARENPGSLYVPEHDPEAQVRHVLQHYGLDPDPTRVMSRCSKCNAPLETATPDEVRPHVPEGVRHHDRFWRCTGCHQIYWPGTHADRIRDAARNFATDE